MSTSKHFFSTALNQRLASTMSAAQCAVVVPPSVVPPPACSDVAPEFAPYFYARPAPYAEKLLKVKPLKNGKKGWNGVGVKNAKGKKKESEAPYSLVALMDCCWPDGGPELAGEHGEVKAVQQEHDSTHDKKTRPRWKRNALLTFV
jgi:hypothetical protein